MNTERSAPSRPAHEGAGDAATPAAALPAWGDSDHRAAMTLALEQARLALAAGDVPIGAVVLDPDGVVAGRGFNTRERDADPAGHAEVVALREAGATRGGWRLEGHTLVVTLEPCVMCAGAAMLARVDRIVFGAFDDKAGACGSVWDLPRDRASLHQVEVVGAVLAAEAADLLAGFFTDRR